MKKRKAKPRPKRIDFGDALSRSRLVAHAESREQSIRQAMIAFCAYWPRACEAILTILHRGEPSLRAHVLEEIKNTVQFDIIPLDHRQAQDWVTLEPEGTFVLDTAKWLCGEVVRLAQNAPPAWLFELAKAEYKVPWLMINGKPAPGFDKWNASLRWGHEITKQGKSRFDAPQTWQVAEAIEHVHWLVRKRRPAGLPPLTQKTKAQWWPHVRAKIPGIECLTEKEKESIRATLDHDTEAALRNEFLKRCKVAFDGLCPADAPGEESPESYPIDT